MLELAAGTGSTVLKDIGTTITGFGATVVDPGAVADVLGAVTTPGTVSLGSGSSLTIGGPVGTGVAIDLGAGDATLTLGDLGDFAGQITHLDAGDVLDLPGLGPIAGVSYDPTQGALVITTAAGVTSLLPVTLRRTSIRPPCRSRSQRWWHSTSASETAEPAGRLRHGWHWHGRNRHG